MVVIFGMVIANMLFGGFSAPITIYNSIHGEFASANFCAFEGWSGLGFGSEAGMSTFTISIERYLVIVKQRQVTVPIMIVMAMMTWVPGLFIGTYPWLTGRFVLRPAQIACSGAWYTREPLALAHTIFCIIMLSSTMVLTVVFYGKTFLVVRSQVNELSGMIKTELMMSSNGNSTIDQSQHEQMVPAADGGGGFWARLRENIKFSLSFFGNGDLDDQAEENSQGARSKRVSFTKKSMTRKQKTQRLEREVLRRSVRIVGLFMFGWCIHATMFAYEAISGKACPYVMDFFGHTMVIVGAVIQPFLLVHDNKLFGRALCEQLKIPPAWIGLSPPGK
ncbi:uncharacterized protein SPPG_07527 [Spizellomyces punctatus DAOM BR117]|uniref:G-protein coupled receptors family 1 profile domain-containing protein n=1 Tax=Spizellomyces punctatus (strain DAOM BR117) TaxID=645134 RepID=A0A0L0H6M5_SPIPD|nr:uncharacterized protein SPPG_07527 [Spizellomyces punctatus DAOM BR117]KNC97135.1 hypothetical protein SPPG_07527 [Spizellomyces punctatus DAOM BR117]|eukprot:XP_016605175.1 hypothetical protein SPPG_07527 [Spizellomyces punctatus DAOM BR117]